MQYALSQTTSAANYRGIALILCCPDIIALIALIVRAIKYSIFAIAPALQTDCVLQLCFSVFVGGCLCFLCLLVVMIVGVCMWVGVGGWWCGVGVCVGVLVCWCVCVCVCVCCVLCWCAHH